MLQSSSRRGYVRCESSTTENTLQEIRNCGEYTWYNSIFCVCWLKTITVQCWRSLYYILIILYIIFLETSCYKTNLPSSSIQKMYGNKNLELSLMCKWGIWYLARAPGKIQNISFSCWFMLHTTGRSVSDVFIVAGGSNGRKSNFENTQCCQVVHIS